MNIQPVEQNSDYAKTLVGLLTKADISVEFSTTAETACISLDMKHIILPVIKSSLSKTITEGFIIHEALGHAVHTPVIHNGKTLDQLAKDLKIPFGIINIVEDARIEKLAAEKFNGVNIILSKMYHEFFFVKKWFMDDISKVNEKTFIDRLNIYFKVGIRSKVAFNNGIESAFVTELSQITEFEQVLDISKRIYDYMKKQVEEEKKETDESETTTAKVSNTDKPNQAEESNTEIEEESNVEIEAEESNIGDSENEESTEESNTEISVEDIEKLIETSEISKNAEITESRKKYLYNSDVKTPVVVPAKQDRDNSPLPLKLIAAKINQEYTNVKIPEFIVEIRKNILKSAKKSSTQLSVEFNQKKSAREESLTSYSDSGELNDELLHEYKTNTELFLTNKTIKTGINHGMYIFFDISYSMADDFTFSKKLILPTLIELIAQIQFCRSEGIKYEVVLFSAGNIIQGVVNRTSFVGFTDTQTLKEMITMLDQIIIGASNVCATEHVALRKCPRIINFTGTRTIDTVFNAIDSIIDFKTKNHIEKLSVNVLTDGQYQNTNVQCFRSVLGYSGRMSETKKIIINERTGNYLTDEINTQLDMLCVIVKDSIPGTSFNYLCFNDCTRTLKAIRKDFKSIYDERTAKHLSVKDNIEVVVDTVLDLAVFFKYTFTKLINTSDLKGVKQQLKGQSLNNKGIKIINKAFIDEIA